MKRKQTAAAPPADDAPQPARYVLRLYIAGASPRSMRAIVNTRKICEAHLQGQYELEIIDLLQHPARAVGEQIIVTPTLVKRLPLPLRRFIGDLSQTESVLRGLNLRSA
ncbi:MAG: circadian clock KaiB family protein [Blastocatellia bacterium]